MSSRILKNNTASPVPIPDTGYTVPASGSLTIPPQQYGKFEGSSNVVTLIGDGTLTVNDGTFDLNISDGTRLIQGGWTQYISDHLDPTVKAAVTSAQSSPYYNNRITMEGVLAGLDALGAFRRVSTKVRSDGLTALVSDSTVVVESTFGFDQQPDSFFRIIKTGDVGDTWTIYIAGTSNDTTMPDRDLPSYTKIFYVLADEVGDELKFRDRIVQTLNADPAFKTGIYMKAQKATDRAIVHVQSSKFSASGEFYERPNSGDFNVTVTGTAQVVIGFDNIVSRSKPVTISRDIDSPHRLGLFGVTGSVSITFKELADLFVQEALYLGSPDMRVAGSLVAPISFNIPAQPNTDIYIEDLIFDGQGNGIKFSYFLNKAKLINGVKLEIKSDNVITTFPIIYATEDFKNKFAALGGDAANFSLFLTPGGDEMLAVLKFANPFVIRAAGTFTTDDYIKVEIRDDISSGLLRFNFRAKGFEKEP